MKIWTTVTAATLSLAMATTTVAPALALESHTQQGHGVATSETTNTVMTADQIDELADNLELLFTRYIQVNADGTFVVQVENIVADGYGAHLADAYALADAFNQVGSPAAVSLPGQFNKTGRPPALKGPAGPNEFAYCILRDGLGANIFVNAPGVLNATRDAIKAWRWGLAASTVARIAGPMAVRALGGPWGIAAGDAMAAYGCRNQL